MDQEAKLLTIINTLAAERSVVLHQTPTDQVVAMALTEAIIDANARFAALTAPQRIQPMTPGEIANLNNTVAALQASVQASAGAVQVLQSITALLKA